MNKTTLGLVAVVVLAVSLRGQGQLPAPEQMSGAFRFTIQDGGKPIAVADRVLDVSMSGKQIAVIDPAQAVKANATVKDGSFVIPMAATTADGRSEVKATVTLKAGGLEATGWTGTALINDMNFAVVVSKLPSLWACSHADPTHTASSTDEMKEQTEKHKCTGWHRVN